jgi:hypothetical protein
MRASIHLLLHLVVPGVVAWLFHRAQFRRAWFVLVATMLVDLDHLLANPLYDPNRCSIGTHPLHTTIPILLYVLLTVFPVTRLIGLGLVIHMALDTIDCAAMRGWQ